MTANIKSHIHFRLKRNMTLVLSSYFESVPLGVRTFINYHMQTDRVIALIYKLCYFKN